MACEKANAAGSTNSLQTSSGTDTEATSQVNIDDEKQKNLNVTQKESSLDAKTSSTVKNCVSQLQLQDWPNIFYSILGLGDTNYTNFCNFGKNLDEKLHKLGAKRSV